MLVGSNAKLKDGTIDHPVVIDVYEDVSVEVVCSMC